MPCARAPIDVLPVGAQGKWSGVLRRATLRPSPPFAEAGQGDRSVTVYDRMEMTPNVMLGKPVIRGTRVTGELLVRKVAEGATEEVLLDAYPRLTCEDIRAALRFAADMLAHEEIVLAPAV